MSSITIEAHDSQPAFVAWRDGSPLLSAEQRALAEPFIGRPLLLTPEGPSYVAGWGSLESAAVLLGSIFDYVYITTDPDLSEITARPDDTY